MTTSEAVYKRALFPTLRDTALARSTRSLSIQLFFAVAIAALLSRNSNWTWLALVAGAVAVHSAWGIIAKRLPNMSDNPSKSVRVAGITAAVVGTGFVVSAAVAFALTLFTGNARGTYDACGPSATSDVCRQLKHPKQLNKLP